MSALPHVLMTQTNPRPASPAAAGLTLTSDGTAGDQGRSFEDTLSDQTDVNLHTADDPIELETILTAERDIQVSDNDVIDRLSVSQHSETEGSVDRAVMMPATNLSSIRLDVSVPLGDAPTTLPTVEFIPTTELIPATEIIPTAEIIPVTDIATRTNREAGLPSFAVAGDPITAATLQPNVPESLTNFTPLRAPQALPVLTETVAAPLTNAVPPTPSTIVADVNPAQTEGAPVPTATLFASDTTAHAETPTSDPDTTDRPRLSDRAAETAEYRTLAKPSAGPSDVMKIADTPAHSTTLVASSDAPTPLKSVPIIAALPTLTPLPGMSDRLAATILQTTNTSPTVTMDKLPQAVVAIALSAKSATLQIDPPELGRIQLDYQFDSQGRTVVTLTPESDAARAALMDRMASITAALEQGANTSIEVKLADARDFGSEFGQASQDGEDVDSRQDDGASGAASDTTQTDDLQRFIRAPLGEAERLHILV